MHQEPVFPNAPPHGSRPRTIHLCKCAIPYVRLSSVSIYLLSLRTCMALGLFGRVWDYLFDNPFNLYPVTSSL